MGFSDGQRTVILAGHLQTWGGEGHELFIAGVNVPQKSIYLDTTFITSGAFVHLIYYPPLYECMFIIYITSPLMIPCQNLMSSHYF